MWKCTSSGKPSNVHPDEFPYKELVVRFYREAQRDITYTSSIIYKGSPCGNTGANMIAGL